MNPEICSLYGVRSNGHSKQLHNEWIRLAKYAVVISTHGLVIPASYLFEIRSIDGFLKELSPVRAAGLFHLASATADLVEYAADKRHEYRDEKQLHAKYQNAEQLDGTIPEERLIWLPRSGSASAQITEMWRSELVNGYGIWQVPLEDKHNKRQLVLPSIMESAIYSAPDKLDGRAFVYRFLEPLLPFDPDAAAGSKIKMLISRAYLESYLDELNAAILVDTPIGGLDCQIAKYGGSGNIRTVSCRGFSQMLAAINIRRHIEERFTWQQLIELKSHPVFLWLTQLAISEENAQNKFFEELLRLSGYHPQQDSLWPKRPYDVVSERLWGFHDKVKPFLTQVQLNTADGVAAKDSKRAFHKKGQTGVPAEKVDIGIVIALPEEFRELVRELGEAIVSFYDKHTGSTYYVFSRPGPEGQPPYTCVAALAGEMGDTSAALLTERLQSRWRVDSIVNVGIAAGINGDVLIGDVVLVSVADGYLDRAKARDASASDNGFDLKFGGEPFRSTSRLLNQAINFEFANHVIHEETLSSCIRRSCELLKESEAQELRTRGLLRERPAVVAGHVASGPIVGDSRNFVQWLKGRDRSLLALEMEAAGVMRAVYSAAAAPEVISLRGISDFADGRKEEFDSIGKGALRQYAMHNALQVLWGLMRAGAFFRLSESGLSKTETA
jgi:nucleoside phosphorylase